MTLKFAKNTAEACVLYESLAVMKSVQLCLLVLLSAQLVREGDGVVTGPRSQRELGQLEPRTIEMEPGEELAELLEKGAETGRRYVRV